MMKILFEPGIAIWRLIFFPVAYFVSWAQVTAGVMQTRLFAGFHEDTRQVLQSLGLLRCVEADFALFSATVER